MGRVIKLKEKRAGCSNSKIYRNNVYGIFSCSLQGKPSIFSTDIVNKIANTIEDIRLIHNLKITTQYAIRYVYKSGYDEKYWEAELRFFKLDRHNIRKRRPFLTLYGSHFRKAEDFNRMSVFYSLHKNNNRCGQGLSCCCISRGENFDMDIASNLSYHIVNAAVAGGRAALPMQF